MFIEHRLSPLQLPLLSNPLSELASELIQLLIQVCQLTTK